MKQIDSYKAASGTWVLYNDDVDKVINVVLFRNNVPTFLIECPGFYDCPDYFLNSVSLKVLREPTVVSWLIRRYRLQEGL